MRKTIGRWLLWAYIYFHGIRFYQGQVEIDARSFRSLTLRSKGGKDLTLVFHEVEYVDYVVRFGYMFKTTTLAYIVRMNVDESYPESLREFHNAKLVFKNPHFRLWDKELISEFLHRACIDYVAHNH